MKTYYTAEEAIKKLDLPRSTFHYLVKKGEIPKVVLPLRKQALYPKSEIDEIAERKSKMLEDLQASPDRLELTVPNRSDLVQLIEIEEAYYHEDTIISVDTILNRLAYSPENIHVLKDKKTDKVVGSLTMSVLSDEVLEKLINLEIDETQVKIEDYKPYKPGQNDVYIVSIVANPCIEEKFYASRLLTSIIDYLQELLEKGIAIRKLYTVAATKEGEKLAKKMCFTLIREGNSEHEEFRKSYVLDLDNTLSKSRLVNRYIRLKRNIARREKRQKTTT